MEFLKENIVKSKKTNCRRSSTDLFAEEGTSNQQDDSPSVSTPIRACSNVDDDESPYYPCSTQEINEDVDVLWDWNSPQSRPKTNIRRKSKKKLNLHSLNPVNMKPLATSDSHEQVMQDFYKLKEEMRLLKEGLRQPDNEDSLILSPREEEVFKSENYVDDIGAFDTLTVEPPKPIPKCDFDDVFNDDLENELIVCSQMVENQLNQKEIMSETKRNDISNRNKHKITHPVMSIVNKKEEIDLDDTLEKLLAEDDDKIYSIKTQQIVMQEKEKKVFPRSNSENFSSRIAKVEWHRTQSFESYNATISKEMLKVIEQKRMEAKAKLKARRKQENAIPVVQVTQMSDSPLKCSPEEIEKKRLQALAKLQAKRQQSIIQKKKMEALKRLEESRKKKATNVKSSLNKKL